MFNSDQVRPANHQCLSSSIPFEMVVRPLSVISLELRFLYCVPRFIRPLQARHDHPPIVPRAGKAASGTAHAFAPFRVAQQGQDAVRQPLDTARFSAQAQIAQVLTGLDRVTDFFVPLTNRYAQPATRAALERGKKVWWYVCCGPKAPYCTLFIDHPGTELRVWLWQTWQRKIAGILVWQSNYWTSNAAFPPPKSFLAVLFSLMVLSSASVPSG